MSFIRGAPPTYLLPFSLSSFMYAYVYIFIYNNYVYFLFTYYFTIGRNIFVNLRRFKVQSKR